MAIDVERISSLVPAGDLAAAVARWSEFLGVAPSFVDGDRWAQFDLPAGGRISLAGADGADTGPAMMVRVADLEGARVAAHAVGMTIGEVQDGPHERRCVARDPDGATLVLYAAR